jgi:hypothetical protein
MRLLEVSATRVAAKMLQPYDDGRNSQIELR